jgi:hypothetical protein
VVNKGGKRVTFGYFIRIQEGGPSGDIERSYSTRMNEFFVLFSYDWIRAKDGNVKYATELFLFGPTRATGCLNGNPDEPIPREQEVENPPRLIFGVAVGPRGRLLSEVPLEIAKVANFAGEKGHENEPVRPGTAENGKGCLVCHKREEGMPQNTGPFPWIRVGQKRPAGPLDACLVRTWESTSVSELHGRMTGGAKARVTFSSDGTLTADYRKMDILKHPDGGTTRFDGRASGRIVTENGVARIESVGAACVSIKVTADETWTLLDAKQPGLGPAGLGGTSDDNHYTCTEESLEYKTSTATDQHATYSVKLKPVKD